MPLTHIIARNGWRQGSVLRTEDHSILPETVRRDLSRGARAVVVSHDCDVTSNSYEKEARIELLVLQPMERISGEATLGKNPRELAFSVRSSAADIPVLAHANGRHFVERKLLENIKPDPDWVLGQSVLIQLRRWLAARYNRSAFPDVFVDRLRPIRNKLKALLNKGGKHISEILIHLDPDADVSATSQYRVSIYAVMPVDRFEKTSYRIEAQSTVDTLEELFASCAGIEVLESELRSEDDVTLDDIRFLRRFDALNYLSYADEDSSATPVDQQPKKGARPKKGPE